MSCCLCSGDHPLHSNLCDISFMEELFSDFSLESDNVCVMCFWRLDNLIDYANTDLTPAVSNHTPPQTQVVPQQIQEAQQIQPQVEHKQVIQASFTMRKINAEELQQITNAKVSNLKRKRHRTAARKPNSLDNYQPMQIIKVNEANLQNAIRRVLQQSLVSKFPITKYV